MKYKFFAIPARHPGGAEEDLNNFCSQHRISFIEKHLIADGSNSFWSVCVAWLDGEAAPSASSQKKPIVDYKQILSETDFNRYLELRNLRKALAESHGVPPYALFTNEQLAVMVQQRIGSKTELQTVPGIGKSRVEKYGDEFLYKLSELWERDSSVNKDETHPD